MKFKLLYIITIVLLFSELPLAHASFRVHKQFAAQSVVMKPASSGHSTAATRLSKVSGFFSKIRSVLHPDVRGMAYSGTIGLVAFLCGAAGFLYPVFGLLAILFGFIGIGQWKRNKGLAIAGLILGIGLIVASAFFGFTPLFLA